MTYIFIQPEIWNRETLQKIPSTEQFQLNRRMSWIILDGIRYPFEVHLFYVILRSVSVLYKSIQDVLMVLKTLECSGPTILSSFPRAASNPIAVLQSQIQHFAPVRRTGQVLLAVAVADRGHDTANDYVCS